MKKNQQITPVNTTQRRDRLREALVDAAEDTIAKGGLSELRARTLAEKAGCAVGAIYNAVEDLDQLVLLVNMRTLAALEHELASARGTRADAAKETDAAISELVRLALAYLGFAASNTPRWRALFEHRMPGREVPDWYRSEQERLFSHIDEPLRTLQPRASAKRRALLARSMFSAVHGLVALGLEEKLQAVPVTALREQTTYIVTALGRGLAAAD